MNVKKATLIKYSNCQFCNEKAMIALSSDSDMLHCENCNIIEMEYMNVNSFGEYSFKMHVEVSFEEMANIGLQAINESNVVGDEECQRMSKHDYPLMVENANINLEPFEEYLMSFAKEKLKKVA